MTSPQVTALETIRRYCDENLGPSRSSLLSKIANIADDALAQPAPEAKVREDLVEQIAQWLHDETAHPDSYPNHTWPESERDDGQRAGGFVKIVPLHSQEYFRDIARRLVARFAIGFAPPSPPADAVWRNGNSTTGDSVRNSCADELEKAALAQPAPEAKLREGVGALIRVAAECHRAKWQFDFNDEKRLSVGMARDMVKRAFDELHRIGDLALKERTALCLPHALAEAVGQLQCLRCGTVDAFGPVSKEKK